MRPHGFADRVVRGAAREPRAQPRRFAIARARRVRIVLDAVLDRVEAERGAELLAALRLVAHTAHSSRDASGATIRSRRSSVPSEGRGGGLDVTAVYVGTW